jgi:hypothetical protein
MTHPFKRFVRSVFHTTPSHRAKPVASATRPRRSSQGHAAAPAPERSPLPPRRHTSPAQPDGHRRPPPPLPPPPSAQATTSAHQPRMTAAGVRRREGHQSTSLTVAKKEVAKWRTRVAAAQATVTDLEQNIVALRKRINTHHRRTQTGNVVMAAGATAAVVGAAHAAPAVAAAGAATAAAGYQSKPKRAAAGASYQAMLDADLQQLGTAKSALRLANRQLQTAHQVLTRLTPDPRSNSASGRLDVTWTWSRDP